MAVHCLSAGIRKLERVVTRHYDSFISTSGVSAVQLPLVSSVYLNPDLILQQQAELLEIDRTTLWPNLRPLIGAGLIVEVTQPRPLRYRLSRKGVAALARAVDAWTVADETLRRDPGERSAKVLEATLRTARRSLRKQAPD